MLPNVKINGGGGGGVMRLNSSSVCKVGVTYVYFDTMLAYYGYILFLYPSLLLNWMFKRDCLDT